MKLTKGAEENTSVGMVFEEKHPEKGDSSFDGGGNLVVKIFRKRKIRMYYKK